MKSTLQTELILKEWRQQINLLLSRGSTIDLLTHQEQQTVLWAA